MMAQQTFLCRHCGKSSRIKPSQASERLQCPHCGRDHFANTHRTVLGDAPQRRFHRIGHATLAVNRQTDSRRCDSLLHGMTLACVVAGFCLLLKLALSSQVTNAQDLSTDSAPGQRAIQEAWRQQVRDIATRYLQCSQIEDLLPLSRPTPSLAEKMRTYYTGDRKLPINGQLTDFFVDSEAENGDRLGMLLFETPSGKLGPLVVAQTLEGFRVDWPSMSGVGEMSLAEFMERRVTTPTLLHVTAWKADYYSYEFADPDRHLCLRLSDVDDAHSLYGYVSLSHAADLQKVDSLRAYDRFAAPSAQCPQGITVQARFPNSGSHRDQVEIISVICLGWYLP